MARKMTLNQAIKFVEEAEKLPANEIDRDKLAEAVKIIAAEAQRSFLARGIRQITELPVDLDESLGEVRIGSDTPFLAGATDVIRDAFTKAGNVLQRLFASDAGPERAIKPKPGTAAPGPAESFSLGRATGGAEATPRPVAAGAGRRLPSDLISRFYKAANAAGVPTSEANAILEDAEDGGGGVHQFPNPLTGETMTIETQAGEGEAEDPAVIVEAWIQEWTQGAIGVDPGFFAQRASDIPVTEGLERFRMERGIGATQRITDVAPQYFSGDQYNWSGLPTETIIRMQTQLEAAGYIGPGSFFGDYSPGVWDKTSSDAMFSIMGMANQSGRDIDEVIADLVANVPESVKEARNQAKLAKQFQADAFVPMDKAAIAQTVKQAIKNRVGRDPSPEELTEIAALVAGFDRADYEQQIAVARAEFEATMAALDTGQYVTPTGLPPDVDPWQQLDALLDQRLATEEDFLEDQESMFENTQRFFLSLTGVDNLIGGI